MDDEDRDYSLICPFFNDDPLFTNGVEFGILFARMRRSRKIDDYFHLANQEQITLLANRCGWKIVKMKKLDEFWVRIKMRKKRKSSR